MEISKIKIIALVLALFIIPAINLSCDNSNSGTENNENIDVPDENNAIDENQIKTDSGSDESANTAETRPEYDLPEKDFGNYNFRIISRSEAANTHWWNCDISADTENGDPINDGVYQRNKKVEERYNIAITNIPDSAVGTKASRSIKSGSDDYDLIVIGLRDGQENLTSSGYLLDLHSMPYVDLSKPWWDQKAVEQLSINNKLFATSCDLTIRDKDAIIILMFSKTLAKNYELEDLYQLVASGKWTFSKMLDMIKAVSSDINGDGVMDDKDQYGLLTEYVNSLFMFNAAGEYISKLNADKVSEITLHNERSAAVCEKIIEICGNKNYAVNAEDMTSKYADIWDGFQISMFSEDRALFYHAGMNRVTLLRTMENDFGIIPPPKYDENQANYYVVVDPWCTSTVSVPITVEDKERTGLILETLAYESRYILLPAYYEINLKTKFARDEESREMIDIILTNRLYDLGEIYNWGNVGVFFEDISRGKGSSLAAYWEKNGLKIEADMMKTLDKLNDLD